MLDGSGSMYSTYRYGDYKALVPIDVGISLAIYFSERNKGPFKDYFMTFSRKPQLVKIKGMDIVQKVNYCTQFNEMSDTNIEAAFDLILQTALKNNLSNEDLPKKIYVISDMEFNICTTNADETFFNEAKRKFNEHGYDLPTIVFWNVNAMSNHFPATMYDNNVTLVSGASATVFNQIMTGDMNPYSYMLSVILKERYDVIKY
jgi:hypothetical protein